MPPQNYRYYCLDATGHLHSAEWFQAESDEDAVALVQANHAEETCEIWLGTRLVAELPPRRRTA